MTNRDLLEKDQRIEHLQRQLNIVSNALRVVDLEVARAASKYLKSSGMGGSLRIGEFLDLLALEMRREIRAESQDIKNLNALRKKIITEEIKANIEKKLLDLMPVFRSKISDYITIHVLIQAKDESWGPLLRGESPKLYRALPLRGRIRNGLGYTPGDAYAALRENMVIELSSANTKEETASFLAVVHENLKGPYNAATPYRTDDIEGFKVEVRVKA